MSSVLDKTSQLVLHFACSIPTRPELKSTEKEALKGVLQEIDSDHFQIFDPPNVAIPSREPSLFSVFRQYPLENALVTGPSMVFTPNSVSIIQVVKIGNRVLNSSGTLIASELNLKMRNCLMKIQDVVKGLKFTRAGKIYEFVIGPISPGEKEGLIKKILARPNNDICELKILTTRIVESAGKYLNLRSEMHFQQVRFEEPFQLGGKIDINNRKLETSLEPRDIDNIWKSADSLIEPLLEEILV